MRLRRNLSVLMAAAALCLGGCAAGISGTVRMVDRADQAVPGAKMEGIVVNLINTTASLEQASSSVKTDEKGNFRADPKTLKPGTYRVEVSEPGYMTVTKTIELKDSSREVDLVLRQLPRGQSQSYRGPSSDRNQIINPGEVNIQPPSM